MDSTEQVKSDITRLQTPSLVVGLAGAAACAYAALGGGEALRQQFHQAYLMGLILVVGFSLGGLGFLLLGHLVKGSWLHTLRRPLEAAARTMPLCLLFFLVMPSAMHTLYEWTHADHLAHDHILQSKAAYLNEHAFFVRSAVYFAVWLLLTFVLTGWSRRQDRDGAEPYATRMRVVSGPGLVLFGLTVTFAAFDWLMSLEPHWFSSIYGALYMVGSGLATLCLLALVMNRLRRHAPLADVYGAQQSHDVGNMIFAFTVLWTYMSFSQFLIIWSGNLYEETFWYLDRSVGGWPNVAILIAVAHFLIPFLLLLNKPMKRNPARLAPVALLILAMRLVDGYWQIGPTFRKEALSLHWLDLAAPLGMLGLWLFVFFAHLKKAPLLASHDPRFSGAGAAH